MRQLRMAIYPIADDAPSQARLADASQKGGAAALIIV
jgi:hypothetical protein